MSETGPGQAGDVQSAREWSQEIPQADRGLGQEPAQALPRFLTCKIVMKTVIFCLFLLENTGFSRKYHIVNKSIDALV